MSADLFAEFGTDPKPKPNQLDSHLQAPKLAQQSESASTLSFFDNMSPQAQPHIPKSSLHHLPSEAVAGDPDEDWAGFEGTVSGQTTSTDQSNAPFTTSQTYYHHESLRGNSVAPTDLVAFHIVNTTQSRLQTWQRTPIVKARKPADSSVLFDAEDDFNDDDFGDFEGAHDDIFAPAKTASGSSALVDLLGDTTFSGIQAASVKVLDPVSTKPVDPQPRSTEKAPATIPNKRTHAKKLPKPAVALAEKQFESWAVFDDWEASIPSTPTTRQAKQIDTTKTATVPSSKMPVSILSLTAEESSPGELPPTNVPPPGVLLSLFPAFFADAQEALLKPMAAQPLPVRNKLLAEPATIMYLQGLLVLANVAAQIIAGRKLRWKRDQHLSQGMRIGPASSRATSGMKLTGIDKGENIKEEREVSDVVRAWKEQLGRLRHVVCGVNQIKADTLSPAPDLQETMPVKTLKQSEGGVPARQPCMLCGLKREERVTAADLTTGDSFGEWWIDQVNMHRGCRNFWNEYKDKLRRH